MLNVTRRTAVALLSSLAAAAARAQTSWPPTVTLIVPFPPGGSTDALSRLLAAHARDKLGSNIIVESESRPHGKHHDV